jgi:hypothetical protein
MRPSRGWSPRTCTPPPPDQAGLPELIGQLSSGWPSSPARRGQLAHRRQPGWLAGLLAIAPTTAAGATRAAEVPHPSSAPARTLPAARRAQVAVVACDARATSTSTTCGRGRHRGRSARRGYRDFRATHGVFGGIRRAARLALQARRAGCVRTPTANTRFGLPAGPHSAARSASANRRSASYSAAGHGSAHRRADHRARLPPAPPTPSRGRVGPRRRRHTGSAGIPPISGYLVDGGRGCCGDEVVR